MRELGWLSLLSLTLTTPVMILIVVSLAGYSLLLFILAFLVSSRRLSRMQSATDYRQTALYQKLLQGHYSQTQTMINSLSRLTEQGQAALASKDPMAYAQVIAANTNQEVASVDSEDQYRSDEELAAQFLQQHGLNLDSEEGRELTGYDSDPFREIAQGQF